jgi:enterochelin esterase-like enzyme
MPDQTKLQIDADPIERVLTGSQPDEYVVDFMAGEFYAVTVLQISVDVIMDIYGPDGEQIASVDTFTADGLGPEEWNETAPATGQYRFVLRKYDTKNPDGKYTMMVRDRKWYIAKWGKENIKSPRIEKLWQNYASNPNAIDDFLAEREGKEPLVEPKDERNVLVTFFIKTAPNISRVKLCGGPVVDGPIEMEKFQDTDFWFVTLAAPKDSRLWYGFKLFNHFDFKEKFVPDNGLTLVLEDAPEQPFEAPIAPDTPCGEVTPLEMESACLSTEQTFSISTKRTFSVYTPPHFDANKTDTYGVLFMFDGEWYGTSATNRFDLPKIMNNAIAAGKVPPMIVVLVNFMYNRDRTLGCHEPFADFMAKELLPEIRRLYPAASHDPKKVIVAGCSFGGIASTFCAMTHPDAFGNVLSQSGSYWIPGADWTNEYFTGIPSEAFFPSQFVEREKLPIRFYMEVGTFEGTRSMLLPNRHLRDILKLKGYDVTYSEFHGNHDYNVWRGTIVEGIACLTREWK